ncbi:serine hydrolase [Elizabethkingia sp. JS20170427COW]|uniref:serine hydrolase domain-containing protein n=1 Tax=Elizabethkingia sp. JS20170427COW TaxID=2583851 RepID=UPI002107C9CA|nr:serine hydrolase [Elizabethkingia sp. JS20170427COW]
MKKMFTIILGGLALIIALMYAFGYDYIFTAIKLTYLKGETGATIKDGPYFAKSQISPGIIQPWEKDSLYNKTPLPEKVLKHLNQSKTASFLVFKDGKILSEQYWDGNPTTLTNSFSMAKSVAVMLTGIAIQDGKIKSLQQKLSDFYPNFAKDPLGKNCTLEDLSSMESGLKWSEDYQNPFGPNAKAYYGKNLPEWMLNQPFDTEPGTKFEYLSGATQLLGFVLRKAVDLPLGVYLSEKIWQPLGMENGAYWGMDQDNGMEKTYCCINATSRDFAKLGQLLLNHGNWNGRQIISHDFVQKMITGTTLSQQSYGNGIWVNNDSDIPHYYLRGLYGQYVICIPQYNMIIVRTGSSRDETMDNKKRPVEVDFFVHEMVKLYQ